ncbi:MAG: type II toxin-antitoxin system RelB/DinJ family antitoxin [Bacilli bacterium]|nr:type II toxin-antitoxin system RelB/DinJ family antitoxin [Bacilli bacterium]
MEKSSIVHTRVSPNVKNECEAIFNKLGITTSYAISLFLSQVSLRKGIPFEISLPETDNLIDFAIGVSTVDSGLPSEKAKTLLGLLQKEIIDLETYEFAIKRMHQKE